MQTYTISFNFEQDDDITLSLDTAKKTVDLRSYGTTMNAQQFIEFAEAVSELRVKLATLPTTDNGNNKENDPALLENA